MEAWYLMRPAPMPSASPNPRTFMAGLRFAPKRAFGGSAS
jgi:hypothetical protein